MGFWIFIFFLALIWSAFAGNKPAKRRRRAAAPRARKPRAPAKPKAVKPPKPPKPKANPNDISFK